jgi:hypothetical protein
MTLISMISQMVGRLENWAGSGLGGGGTEHALSGHQTGTKQAPNIHWNVEKK